MPGTTALRAEIAGPLEVALVGKGTLVFEHGGRAIHFDRWTKVVVAPGCDGRVEGATILANGEKTTVEGFPVEAVPAYNLVANRPDGSLFLPKGEGNGHAVTFGETRVYVAGDTENVPERKALEGIDVHVRKMPQAGTVPTRRRQA